MENQGTLTQWLLDNKEAIDFSVIEYAWVDDYARGHFDFGVTIGDDINGRAIDKSAELALTKAIAEAIERATCVHNGLKKSAGVAAHQSFTAASKNAVLELIERIAFDIHFSKRLPFTKAEAKTKLAISATAALKPLGITLSFHQLVSPEGRFVLCGVAEGAEFETPFGGIIGLACRDSNEDAEEAALFESLRNVAFQISTDMDHTLSLDEFRNLSEPTSFDRFGLCLDLAYWEMLSFLFDTSADETVFPQITIASLELEKPTAFSTAPIVIARAQSDYKFSAPTDLPSILE